MSERGITPVSTSDNTFIVPLIITTPLDKMAPIYHPPPHAQTPCTLYYFEKIHFTSHFSEKKRERSHRHHHPLPPIPKCHLPIITGHGKDQLMSERGITPVSTSDNTFIVPLIITTPLDKMAPIYHLPPHAQTLCTFY